MNEIIFFYQGLHTSRKPLKTIENTWILESFFSWIWFVATNALLVIHKPEKIKVNLLFALCRASGTVYTAIEIATGHEVIINTVN